MKRLLVILGVLCLPMTAWAAQGKAIMKGTAPDSKISGEVTLVEKNNGIELNAKILNAPPGKHGFHIHEKGSCEDMGKAAGGHFNPDNVMHGFLPKNGHQHAHVGDMGSITINKKGVGTLKVFMSGLSLQEGKYDVANKAVILHEKVDDFSQPTGNAGGRIGCGIIEVEQKATSYTCPMHPEVHESKPGVCPKCGMQLIEEKNKNGSQNNAMSLQSVDPKLKTNYVCMMNNKYFGADQIPVEVEGKTYYGCCQGCVQSLKNNRAMRYAIDPYSGEEVDKANAYIVLKPDGSQNVMYFKSAENYTNYLSKK